MSNVAVFNFDDVVVRAVIGENGEPWFVATDVCKALEHSDTSMAVRRLDADEKGTSIVCTKSGDQRVLVINESGLYSLILTSRKPEAKRFKKWVTSEVLPAIRKTGSYSVPKPQKLITCQTATKADSFGSQGYEPVRMPTPIDTEQQMLALKRVMLDEELKAAAPLVWQHLSDAVQNQALAFLGVTQLPLLEESGVVHPLDVTELAKRAGLSIPSNYRGTCGKYVADRCSPVKIERVVNGAVRVCNAYTNHAAATAAIREFLGKIEA